jgi:hypothetical protein
MAAAHRLGDVGDVYSGVMVPLVAPLHMGALHPVESLAMAALALGPFVVLAVVVTVVSRRDRRAERGSGLPQGRGACGQATRADLAHPAGATATTSETAAPQSVQQ